MRSTVSAQKRSPVWGPRGWLQPGDYCSMGNLQRSGAFFSYLFILPPSLTREVVLLNYIYILSFAYILDLVQSLYSWQRKTDFRQQMFSSKMNFCLLLHYCPKWSSPCKRSCLCSLRPKWHPGDYWCRRHYTHIIYSK